MTEVRELWNQIQNEMIVLTEKNDALKDPIRGFLHPVIQLCLPLSKLGLEDVKLLVTDLRKCLEKVESYKGLGPDQFSASALVVLGTDIMLDSLFGINLCIEGEDVSEAVTTQLDSPDYAGSNLLESALNTSYLDFWQVFERMSEGQQNHFVDPGAGMGRAWLLAKSCFPHIRVTAIELLSERLQPAADFSESVGWSTEGLVVGDLLTPDVLPRDGDVYFLYLPVGVLLTVIEDKLAAIAVKHPITIIAIESHGDLLEWVRRIAWAEPADMLLKVSLPRHAQDILTKKSRPFADVKLILEQDREKRSFFRSLLDRGRWLRISDRQNNDNDFQLMASVFYQSSGPYELMIEESDKPSCKFETDSFELVFLESCWYGVTIQPERYWAFRDQAFVSFMIRRIP